MDKTTLTIVRHGETEWNIAGRIQGFQNSQLTENGRRQVEMLSEALSHRSFDAVYSSDQGRAVDTARIINRYHSLEIHTDPAMRERNFGVMEGHTLEQIKEKYPEVYQGYRQRKADYRIPDGESLVQLYNRVTNGLKRIVETHPARRILIVAHGGVLDCTMRMVFNYTLDTRRNFEIQNAAINTFYIYGSDWNLAEWGNTDHFRGIRSLNKYK